MSHLKKQVVLPYDLERDIFELAAYAFPGHAIKLCTLSKYVQQWMEAIIYETVVLELSAETTDLFMQTFRSRPPSFFAKTVKRLYITGFLPFYDARAIIAACTGATEVTCWAYPHTFTASLLPDLPTPALRRLSIPLEALWGMSPASIQLTPALFPHLSHLEIVNPPGHSMLKIDWAGLAALPALTHFALGELCLVDHAQFIPPLRELLDGCPGLEVLVIITSNGLFRDELCKSGVADDARVVVQPDFNGALMVHEYWEGVRKGGPDFWAMADKAVRDSARHDAESTSGLTSSPTTGSMAVGAA